ncbi:MAG: hypothetical protein ACK5HZ_00020 [Macellibacteroides fermentans]|uniref:hypothetical protein n=1 Tax=Macellibacteroides fermentans TaxID=879969 RepID=UPI003AC0DCF4
MIKSIIESNKQEVLSYTGSGKPSFKKFQQAIKGLKNEMEIVLSIEDLLNDSNKGGTEVWARFIRNCEKFYGIRLKKYKTMKQKQELGKNLENNDHLDTMELVIVACSKIQHFSQPEIVKH